MLHVPRLPHLALVALTLQLVGAPVSAQDRLFVRGLPDPSQPPSPAQEFGAIARLGQPLGARPFWVSSDVVGGGRFMVHFRGNVPGLGFDAPAVVVETLTGRQVAVSGVVVAADPIRPRVYTWLADTLSVADLDHGTASAVLAGVPLAEATQVQYAPNADVLFVSRASALVALDGSSGAVRRTLPALGAVAGVPTLAYPDLGAGWLATPDASRVFALAADGSAVRVIDGTTGAEVARSPLGGGANGVLMPDWAGERIFAVQGTLHAWLLSAITTSGQALGNAPLSGRCPPAVRSSPHTGRVYLSSFGGGGGSYYGPITQALSAFDGATLGALGHTTIADNLDQCGGIQFVLVSPPGPPRDVSASTSGHDVTLRWTNRGYATDFVLDVGYAPGQTALTLPLGATTSQTIPNAPSGRYYARIRGGNLFGSSPASSEITIVVP